MSHCAGESFAYSVLDVAPRAAATSSAAVSGRLLDVRARQVQLDRGDPVVPVETRAAERVVVRREAPDRDPDRHPELRQPWQALSDEPVDAGPLQADRVQHSVLGLRDPDRWVAGAWERRDRLRHDDVE
jgi:hypothetical protein